MFSKGYNKVVEGKSVVSDERWNAMTEANAIGNAPDYWPEGENYYANQSTQNQLIAILIKTLKDRA